MLKGYSAPYTMEDPQHLEGFVLSSNMNKIRSSQSEWSAYSCKIPKTATDSSVGSCRVLSKVHHVAHVSEARRILEDGRIRAGLVHDESRLNRARLCVAWLSANTWGNGSIYGSVQFTFDWHKIIEGRKVYWVEAMTEYNPSAYRLLLTERRLSDSNLVQAYDPGNDGGPLKCKDGVWYWNGEYTSEFMVEADLSLDWCREVEFIQHHRNVCRHSSGSCPERRATSREISCRMLAFILGHAIHAADEALWPAGVNFGINGILWELGSKSSWFTGEIEEPSSSQVVLRGALALYGSDQQEAARELIALLANQKTFEKTLRDIVAEHFNRSDYKIPE